ncbi:rubredoxin [Aureococcus anophagefferens]|nr:rubredoxin [Aureococcus anophagefferens]
MVRALVAFALCAHAAVALQLRAPSPVARGASAARRPRVLRSSEVVRPPPPPPTPSRPPAAPRGVAVVMEEDDGLTERRRDPPPQAGREVRGAGDGSHQCIICDFQYQPAKGCAGAAPGTDRGPRQRLPVSHVQVLKDKFQP